MVWKVQPSNVNESLPKEAIDILRKLELASHYNNKRAYNKVLKKLKEKYPDKEDMINEYVKAKPKGNHLQKAMQLSREEKQWIESWKHIRK